MRLKDKICNIVKIVFGQNLGKFQKSKHIHTLNLFTKHKYTSITLIRIQKTSSVGTNSATVNCELQWVK